MQVVHIYMGTPDWVKQAQKDERRYRAVDQVFERVKSCASSRDALRLLTESPDTRHPGREVWSNFHWFMTTFQPPHGASGREITEYQRLLQVFLAEGMINSQIVHQFEDRLNESKARLTRN